MTKTEITERLKVMTGEQAKSLLREIVDCIQGGREELNSSEILDTICDVLRAKQLDDVCLNEGAMKLYLDCKVSIEDHLSQTHDRTTKQMIRDVVSHAAKDTKCDKNDRRRVQQELEHIFI